MCLDDGRWAGRQIVPKDWLTESFTAAVSIPDERRYGYHWYRGAVPTAGKDPGVHWEKTVSAIGNGGQRLFLLPHRNLAVAITAGNYDTQDQWRPPMVLLRDVLLPVLGGRK